MDGHQKIILKTRNHSIVCFHSGIGNGVELTFKLYFQIIHTFSPFQTNGIERIKLNFVHLLAKWLQKFRRLAESYSGSHGPSLTKSLRFLSDFNSNSSRLIIHFPSASVVAQKYMIPVQIQIQKDDWNFLALNAFALTWNTFIFWSFHTHMKFSSGSIAPIIHVRLIEAQLFDRFAQ